MVLSSHWKRYLIPHIILPLGYLGKQVQLTAYDNARSRTASLMQLLTRRSRHLLLSLRCNYYAQIPISTQYDVFNSTPPVAVFSLRLWVTYYARP